MYRHLLSFMCALFSLVLISACGEEEKDVEVQSIAISQPSAEMEIGETLTLKATVSPSNASYDGMTWTSTNPKVASVTGTGLVSALSAGSTTITVMAGGKTASCSVTVVKGVVAVSSISLSKSSLEMVEGDTETLIASVLPEDATDKTVTWSSSNEKVATVKDGVVLAVSAGETTITAKAGDKTATCKVTVQKKVIAVESIELNKANLTLVEGDSESLTATVKPDDATDKSVTWTSSNDGIATVDSNGKVVAVKEGEAIISAKAGEKTATCKIVVQKKVIPVASIELDKVVLELVEGDTETITTTVKPDNATDKTVSWTSSNNGIATIKDGVVTAISEGEAIITATAGDKSATCKVVVKKKVIPVESVELNRTVLELVEGDSESLTATVKPDDATDKSVSWTSSNNGIATVKDGVVTAVSEGEATITAKAGDKTATCKVIVSKKIIAVESIALNKTEITLVEGDWETLSATVLPADATDKSISWESSDEAVATVDNVGKVTAVKEGSATITAKAGNKTASCKVTVQKKVIDVQSIELDKSELTMYEGDTETLTATVLPENATDKSVTWTSSNESIVTVKDGVVSAILEGEAIVTAKAGDKTASCKVVVKKREIAVESVTLNKTSLSLKVGESVTLTATVLPDNATNKKVSWKSSNSSVATVDSNGKVKAVAGGSATITATADGVSATCSVTVTVPVTSVTLNKTELTLAKGSSETLIATVNPSNATNKGVEWSSDNTAVATVDKNGKVTAIDVGSATITVKTKDGSKKATCKITVILPENTEPIGGGDDPDIEW